MSNFTKSIVYSGVVLVAGLVAVFTIYNNMAVTDGAGYANIEPAAGISTAAPSGIAKSANSMAHEAGVKATQAVENASKSIKEVSDHEHTDAEAVAHEGVEGVAEDIQDETADALDDSTDEAIDTIVDEATDEAMEEIPADATDAQVDAAEEAAEDAAEEVIDQAVEDAKKAAEEAAQDATQDAADDTATEGDDL